jgi:alpha-1,2-mannosyltransferase
MEIYRFGGGALLHDRPLYDRGLTGRTDSFLFNYPPFAAALFVPLTLLPVVPLRLLTQAVNLALLTFTVSRCVAAVGAFPDSSRDRRGLTAFAVAGVLWIEPVRTNLALGQINLALLALVVFDLLPAPGAAGRHRRYQGVGVGIAAGIKLTPLLFIPYLVLAGRARAAAVAAVTFGATVVTGFALAPQQAARYWFGGAFADLSRVAPHRCPGNTSLRGLFDSASLPPRAGVFAAAALTVVGLGVASRAARAGRPVLGVALCGMASAVASPFSWGYHWVWFVPVLIAFGWVAFSEHRLGHALAAVTIYVLAGAWMTERRLPGTGEMPTIGVISLHAGGLVEHLTRSAYVLIFVLSVAVTARVSPSVRRARLPSRPVSPVSTAAPALADGTVSPAWPGSSG